MFYVISWWRRFLHNYGYICASVLVNVIVAGIVIYSSRYESLLRTIIFLALSFAIVSLVMSETKDMFRIKIGFPDYPRLSEEEEIEEVKRAYRENGLK